MYWYGAAKIKSGIQTAAGLSYKQYHVHVNRARGLAILVVVSGHILDFTVSGPELSVVNLISQLMLGNGSAIFVFISGFLYLAVCKNRDFARFLSRKFSHVILPYALISLPAIAVYVSGMKSHPWLPEAFLAQSAWLTVPYFFLTGSHLGPLWFIPMIFLCYLASPALARVTRSSGSYCLLPLLVAVPLLVPRPPSNSNPIQAFIHFAPVYMGGMLCFKHHNRLLRLWREKKALCGAVFLLGSAATALAGHYLSGASTVLRALETCAAFCVLHEHNSSQGAGWKVLEFLSATSFAVYFLHGYVLGAARSLTAPMAVELTAGSLPVIFAAVLGVVLLCASAAKAARKILGSRSRHVIGY